MTDCCLGICHPSKIEGAKAHVKYNLCESFKEEGDNVSDANYYINFHRTRVIDGYIFSYPE